MWKIPVNEAWSVSTAFIYTYVYLFSSKNNILCLLCNTVAVVTIVQYWSCIKCLKTPTYSSVYSQLIATESKSAHLNKNVLCIKTINSTDHSRHSKHVLNVLNNSFYSLKWKAYSGSDPKGLKLTWANDDSK